MTSTGAVLSRPLSGPIGWHSIPTLKAQAGLGPDALWRKDPRINLQAVTPITCRRRFAGVAPSAERMPSSLRRNARDAPARPAGERLLVETPPHDPVSIAAAALLTLAAGLIGCLRPAERAAKTDPAEVLRD